MRRVLGLRRSGPDGAEVASEQAWKFEGGGVLFRVFRKLFRIVDRPWKMYPLGVLFGLGFDTSSEIALLGISSVEGSKGTGFWIILLFPVLFTAGMCLVDTMDGALMLTVYLMPAGVGEDKGDLDDVEGQRVAARRAKDPIPFLYYSIVLTALTVMVALVIGTIQLLTMILNVAEPEGRFWDGVENAGEHYEVIGGGICASFVVVGGLSVLAYRPWRRRWVDCGNQNEGEQRDDAIKEASEERHTGQKRVNHTVDEGVHNSPP